MVVSRERFRCRACSHGDRAQHRRRIGVAAPRRHHRTAAGAALVSVTVPVLPAYPSLPLD